MSAQCVTWLHSNADIFQSRDTLIQILWKYLDCFLPILTTWIVNLLHMVRQLRICSDRLTGMELAETTTVATGIRAKMFIFIEYEIQRKKSLSLQWRHNGRDGVSNHQPHACFFNRWFRRRSKKTSKFRVTGHLAGNSPGTGEFHAQMASNAENVSIWWRHHVKRVTCL